MPDSLATELSLGFFTQTGLSLLNLFPDTLCYKVTEWSVLCVWCLSFITKEKKMTTIIFFSASESSCSSSSVCSLQSFSKAILQFKHQPQLYVTNIPFLASEAVTEVQGTISRDKRLWANLLMLEASALLRIHFLQHPLLPFKCSSPSKQRFSR